MITNFKLFEGKTDIYLVCIKFDELAKAFGLNFTVGKRYQLYITGDPNGVLVPTYRLRNDIGKFKEIIDTHKSRGHQHPAENVSIFTAFITFDCLFTTETWEEYQKRTQIERFDL